MTMQSATSGRRAPGLSVKQAVVTRFPIVKTVLAPPKRRVMHVLRWTHEGYTWTRRRVMAWRHKHGRRHACYLCGRTCGRFYPLFADGHCSALFRELQVIGSDLENFYCPHCFSFDRERHLFMYFDRLDLWKSLTGSVLHFAPEKHVRARIAASEPEEYVVADLHPASDDVRRMSVTAIDFPAGHFDVVLCNHVLEHVPEDSVAMAEIFRVLKRGGRAILQTPYSTILARSFEDANIGTHELRTRLYGQNDHVRIYGQDFFTKLERAGFVLDVKTHDEVMPEIDGAYHGINAREDLILVYKP